MQSNRYFFIAIIIGAIIIAASIVYVNRPPNIDVHDNEESTQTGDKPELIPEPEPEPTPVSAQSTVKTLVQEYLSETGPQILKTEKENIEVIIKDYPIEPQPASEAITVRATEEEEIEYTLEIKTQDWVYAALGIENTFLGGFVDGQEDKLDLGLYSFLQAAALNIDEPEHLSNVAFHLNNKGDYENAKILLQYALTLDENYFPALSNLAYAYAGLGDYTEAILVQLKVISIHPETWSYLRLADYYEKAGLPEASEAVIKAIEGSEEESIPPTPPILTLSSNGESVMAEIEKLVLSLDAKNQAILDSLDPRIDDIFDKFGNDFLDIWDRALGGCAVPLLFSDEDADACATCIIPAYIESTNLVSSIYAETLPLIQSYESKAFQELEKHTRQAVETVKDADLDESEREALLKEIHRRFTIKYTRIIMDPRIGLKLFLAWNRLVILMSPGVLLCLEDSNISTEIPTIEEVNWECETLPALCKKWKVWFLVGSMSYDPETRDFDLSFGQGVAVKYKYNFARDVSSVGVGYGINLDKVIEAGGTLYFNPTDGVQGELSAEFSSPVPMLILDMPTSVETSKPLFGSFVN